LLGKLKDSGKIPYGIDIEFKVSENLRQILKFLYKIHQIEGLDCHGFSETERDKEPLCSQNFDDV